MKIALTLAFSLMAFASADALEVVKQDPAARPANSLLQTSKGTPGTHCEPLLNSVSAGASDWRSIVSVGRDPNFLCNGILVHPSWVLTMDYCALGNRPVGIFVSGKSDADVAQRVEVVERASPQREFANDQKPVLLKLAEPIMDVEVMTLADVSMEKALAVTEAFALQIGSGQTTESRNLGFFRIALPLVSADQCAAAYLDEINDDALCIGYLSVSPDSCAGSAGAPVLMHGGLAGWQLVGLVSWGRDCGEPGKFTVAQRASNIEEWVRSVTAGAPIDP